MLATLPVQSAIRPFNGKDRFFSLIMSPVFGQTLSSGEGPGPERPIIIEEETIEEEVFTFAYPEKGGEISDIVNPPVEGIAGEVLHVKSKVKEDFNARVSSDIFFYLFINPQREVSTNMPGAELVSLTKQSEIASSYVPLLVYSAYAGSDANFTYTPDAAYEGADTGMGSSILYHGENDLFYASRFPMAMFSDKGDYQGEETSVNYQALELDQNYTNIDLIVPMTEVGFDALPIPKYDEVKADYSSVNGAISLPVDVNISDLLLKDTSTLDMQLAKVTGQDATFDWTVYRAPNLESDLVRNKAPVLDVNNTGSENEVVLSPLEIDSYIDTNMVTIDIEPTTPIAKLLLDTLRNLKYDDVKYEAAKTIATLPFNLGFDDTLVRDRFIAGLNVQLEELTPVEMGHDFEGRIPDGLPIAETYSLPEYKGGMEAMRDLDDLVRVSYDNGITSFSGNMPSLISYDSIRVDVQLQAQPNVQASLITEPNVQLQAQDTLITEPGYEGLSFEHDLEHAVEQENELAEEKYDVQPEVQEDNAAQEDVYEGDEADGNEEAKDDSVSYAASAAGVAALGLAALLSSPFSLLKAIIESDSDSTSDYLQEEQETKQENPKDYSKKKCISVSAKDSEYEVSGDFAKTTQLDGEKSKKLCFKDSKEKGIDPEDFAKTKIMDSDEDGSKKFCFKRIDEGDNGYVNIDGVEYMSYTPSVVDHEYVQGIQSNPGKSVINIRGKNGGDLTSQYHVSNKSIIAALYAKSMDDVEDGGRGLTLDVRLDRDLDGYETLNEGQLTIKGILGLDDFDSEYIIQAVKRDESGNVVERFFPRGENGEFLSIEQELPELYKGYDLELVRLESRGEKAWQIEQDIPLILSSVNQDSERILKNGRYAPILSQLTDENGESIGRAYLVGDKFQITPEDVHLGGSYTVASDRAVDRDENPLEVELRNNGLLAILDRKLQEQGLDGIHKTMPTQKNRVVLNDNEVYMQDIAGLQEQLEKIHSYVPRERWSMLVVEEDTITGELSEPGYDPEKGMQFTPEVGKTYRIIVGDGSDISRARFKEANNDDLGVNNPDVVSTCPLRLLYQSGARDSLFNGSIKIEEDHGHTVEGLLTHFVDKANTQYGHNINIRDMEGEIEFLVNNNVVNRSHNLKVGDNVSYRLVPKNVDIPVLV